MPFNPATLKLFKTAFAKREAFKKITNAVRLVNGPGDGLNGLVLEQYNNNFVAQVFEARWLSDVKALADFLSSTFEVEYLIIKDRSTSASSVAQQINFQVIIQKFNSQTIVEEYGLKFGVDLNDGLNCGLFLDMRANRCMIGQGCSGKKVLNCFAYTSSFGVHARAAGAQEVINVDISSKILDKSKANYALNNLVVGPGEFIKADSVGFLKRAVKKENRFDVIILDPPSFARHEGKTFQVKRDLPELIALSVKSLNPKGTLLAATNSSELNHSDLERMLGQGLNGRKAHGIKRLGQDTDFPGTGLSKESHLVAITAQIT